MTGLSGTSPRIPTPTHPSLGARLRRLAAIVLVFIVVGPPVGMPVLVLSMMVSSGRTVDPLALVVVGMVTMHYAVPLYLAVLKPVVAVGLLVGIRQAFFGAITWPFAIAGGIAAGLVSLLLSGQPIRPRSGDDAALAESAAIVTGYLSCTFVCWAIVQNWYFEPARADKVPA